MSHPDRPNFLIICTDQMRADHMGCAGNAVIRTPNLDRKRISPSRGACPTPEL